VADSRTLAEGTPLIDEMPGIRRATQVGRDEIEKAIAETGGDLKAMVRRLKISRHGLQRRLRELELP
jgi:two-component system nitrogen regulation response regulator GlnG